MTPTGGSKPGKVKTAALRHVVQSVRMAFHDVTLVSAYAFACCQYLPMHLTCSVPESGISAEFCMYDYSSMIERRRTCSS